MRLALSAALLAAGGEAFAELHSWHNFDESLLRTPKFEVAAHQRVRTRHEFGYLDQGRISGQFRWSAHTRATPFVQYDLQPQQIDAGHWVLGHRVLAGVETRLRESERLRITGRLAWERFLNTGRPDYHRARTYVRSVFGRGRVAPFVQNEVFAVRNGYHSVRNSGGFQVRLSDDVSFEAGYSFDTRRAFWGGDRHAIVTSIRIRRAPTSLQ